MDVFETAKWLNENFKGEDLLSDECFERMQSMMTEKDKQLVNDMSEDFIHTINRLMEDEDYDKDRR